mgnify:CR=1 FL=1
MTGAPTQVTCNLLKIVGQLPGLLQIVARPVQRMTLRGRLLLEQGNALLGGLDFTPRDLVAIEKIIHLVEEAGVPPGVVNEVHGSADTVTAILDHPEVAGITFVGSTPVARTIYGRAAAGGRDGGRRRRVGRACGGQLHRRQPVACAGGLGKGRHHPGPNLFALHCNPSVPTTIA